MLRYKKVGGLTFVRVGRFQLSGCVVRHANPARHYDTVVILRDAAVAFAATFATFAALALMIGAA